MNNDMPVAVRFDDSQFACEVFEREIVVLQMAEGTYYALGGAAVALWPDLVAGRGLARIEVAVERRAAAAGMGAALRAFIASLIAERMLMPIDRENPGALQLDATATDKRLEPPTLEKHVDMQELLTLDPIHEVDPQRGWPHTP